MNKVIGAQPMINCAHSILILAVVFLVSCKGNISVSPKAKETFSVSNVQVINNQIIVTGQNLNAVSEFKIKENSTVTATQIESQTSTRLVANTLSNVTFAAGRVFDFILSNASAASTFNVNFSLCDSTLGGKGFDCNTAPSAGDVLTYNDSTNKWEPKALNISGMVYKGSWDANDVSGFPTGSVAGDYYIVSVATSGGGSPHYNVGDWIVFNAGSGTFDHVANSTTRQEGDYSLTQLSDVDLSTPAPANGMVLKYNGSAWVPGTITTGSGTVTSVSVTPPLAVSTATTTPALSIAPATTSADGYLSSTDWNTFNNKQAAITAGTTAQYYRGDKTFQTLNTSVVPESGNLYFTDARTRAVAITGFNDALTGPITAADTIVQAFGRTQNQLNALSGGGSNYLIKNSSDTLSGAISLSGTITSTVTGDVIVNGTPLTMNSAVNKSYADGKLDKTTGGTVAGVVSFDDSLRLKGTTNYVTLKAHTTTAAYNFVLPSSAGTNGHVLQTDGNGNTSWVAMSGGGGAVSSVNSQTGAVVLTSDNITEGSTNLYATNARTIASTITAPTLTNSAIATSDTIQVAFGKLQAQLNNVVSKTLTGLAAGSNTVIAAGDTLLVALANLQAQITYLGSNKADTSNSSQSITASAITATTVTATNLSVANAPLTGTDAANKTYVDGLQTWEKGGSGAAYYTGGNVGIGTSWPSGKLHVLDGVIVSENMTTASGGPNIAFWKHRNYGASADGDELGYLSFIGHDGGSGAGGSGLIRSAYIVSQGEGTPVPNSVPANFRFYTMSPGATTTTEKLHIAAGGNVGIGTTGTPVAKLEVNGEIKFGNTSSTCNGTNEGQQRYNSGTKVMEFCNGTAWSAFGSGGGGGSGGLTGCPTNYTLIAASNTHGTNSFCINTTIKADATLPAQQAVCMAENAELCKNRQLSAAMDALPNATLTEWTNVWTGDITFGAVHNIIDVSSNNMMVYEAKSGWRQIGSKASSIYGNYTANIPANSPFGGFCCKQ